MIFLNWKGYKTLKPAVGSDVMELVREHHPEYTILDTPLVGVFSLKEIKTLKAKKNFKDKPVIVVTALWL